MEERSSNIRAYLLRCGIRPHLRGFRALEAAIALALDDVEYLDGVTKRLYPDVALCVNSTASAVERNIRVAILRAADCGADMPTVLGFPPSIRTGCYTPSEFISAAVMHLGG